MTFPILLAVSVVSGLYTSLWGAFKDSPYEGLKLRTFPRSIYFNVVILLTLYTLPWFEGRLQAISPVQVFFLTMGVERFLAEIYKGFFRTEDQDKYFVPSRITLFGRHVASDLLRYAVGAVIVSTVFAVMLIEVPITGFWWFALIAYSTGLLVSLGGAYKDAPFEGFQLLKFQRSGVVLAVLSPLFYFLNDSAAPISVGFLVYMNGGLERFVIEYYKTYIQRNMSGKFRPDLERIQRHLDTRERFHYVALVILAALVVVHAYELYDLHAAAAAVTG
ncbi:MAG: hypothetical protein VX733_09085 [Candidatus Latescibacterota bacterium]|nr:hypothetical protein [Candidatus Latescibacterota bacterium]